MTTVKAKTTQVDLFDRTKNMQLFLSHSFTAAPPGAVTPSEHAGEGNLVSCAATTRNFSIVTREGIVFFPKGSVYIPERMQGHPYLAAQGVTLT